MPTLWPKSISNSKYFKFFLQLSTPLAAKKVYLLNFTLKNLFSFLKTTGSKVSYIQIDQKYLFYCCLYSYAGSSEMKENIILLLLVSFYKDEDRDIIL